MPKWHVLGSNILLPWSKLLLFYHMLWLSGHNLAQWLSKYGFWTSRISFTWELVRNTNSQAPPQTSVQFSGSVMSDSLLPHGVSASGSVLPVNIQDRFPLGWTGWLSLQSKPSLLQHHSLKASILRCSAFFIVQLSHPYMTYWSWNPGVGGAQQLDSEAWKLLS